MLFWGFLEESWAKEVVWDETVVGCPLEPFWARNVKFGFCIGKVSFSTDNNDWIEELFEETIVWTLAGALS